MKFNLLLANADGRLDSLSSRVQNATRRAEVYINQKLSLVYDINLVFSSIDMFLIPEDGVGGRTYWYDFIIITLNPERNPSEDVLFEIICHETAHAARWSKNTETMNTLFDGIINEGLAVVCEESTIAENELNKRQVFINTIKSRTNQENAAILTTLKPYLDNFHYNYDEIFFTGNKDLPRWAGYSAGYYLVKKYLAKDHKSVWQALFDSYVDFRMVL